MSPHHAHLLAHAGYGAIMLAIAIESLGIPFPGEATLIAAAIYAGTSHGLDIWLVIAAAAFAAFVGGVIGYWLGGSFGFWLLLRYGPYVGLNERRIKLGQYLFLRHGGKVVFFGRFVAVLRALASFLAGANRMGWPRFLVFNALGGAVWASVYGWGAYSFGKQIHHLLGPVGIGLGVVAVVLIIAGFVFLKKNETRLENEAERVLPGPIRHPDISRGRDAGAPDSAGTP
ncbi:MAG TPA: DedA family protein [Acetobacteraceae bacterium]